MLLYYVVFAIILVSFIPKEKFGKYIAWFAFVLMFLMTYFRAEDVGTDTINYLVYGTDHRANEFLCMWIVSLIETGVLPDYGMIYVLASVTYLFLLLNVIRFRIDIRYLVLFFFLSDFFIMGMNISRQVAAISLVSFFVPFALAEQRSKRLLFFVGIVLGMGLHTSSIFGIVLYPALRYLHVSKDLSVVLILFVTPVLLFNILPIDTLVGYLIPDTYEGYASVVERNVEVSMLGYLFKLFMLSLYAYLIYFIEDDKIRLLFVFGVFASNAVIGMNPFVARAFYIFPFLNILSYVHVSNVIDKSNLRESLPYFFMILLSTYFTFHGIKGNPDLNDYSFAL